MRARARALAALATAVVLCAPVTPVLGALPEKSGLVATDAGEWLFNDGESAAVDPVLYAVSVPSPQVKQTAAATQPGPQTETSDDVMSEGSEGTQPMQGREGAGTIQETESEANVSVDGTTGTPKPEGSDDNVLGAPIGSANASGGGEGAEPAAGAADDQNGASEADESVQASTRSPSSAEAANPTQPAGMAKTQAPTQSSVTSDNPGTSGKAPSSALPETAADDGSPTEPQSEQSDSPASPVGVPLPGTGGKPTVQAVTSVQQLAPVVSQAAPQTETSAEENSVTKTQSMTEYPAVPEGDAESGPGAETSLDTTSAPSTAEPALSVMSQTSIQVPSPTTNDGAQDESPPSAPSPFPEADSGGTSGPQTGSQASVAPKLSGEEEADIPGIVPGGPAADGNDSTGESTNTVLGVPLGGNGDSKPSEPGNSPTASPPLGSKSGATSLPTLPDGDIEVLKDEGAAETPVTDDPTTAEIPPPATDAPTSPGSDAGSSVSEPQIPTKVPSTSLAEPQPEPDSPQGSELVSVSPPGSQQNGGSSGAGQDSTAPPSSIFVPIGGDDPGPTGQPATTANAPTPAASQTPATAAGTAVSDDTIIEDPTIQPATTVAIATTLASSVGVTTEPGAAAPPTTVVATEASTAAPDDSLPTSAVPEVSIASTSAPITAPPVSVTTKEPIVVTVAPPVATTTDELVTLFPEEPEDPTTVAPETSAPPVATTTAETVTVLSNEPEDSTTTVAPKTTATEKTREPIIVKITNPAPVATPNETPVPSEGSANSSLTPVIVGPPQESVEPHEPFPSNSPQPETVAPTADSDVIIVAHPSPAASPSEAPSVEPPEPVVPVNGTKTPAEPTPSPSPSGEPVSKTDGSKENGATGTESLSFGDRESDRAFAAGMGILGVLLLTLLGVCLFFALMRGSYSHYTGGSKYYRGGPEQASFEERPSQAAAAAIRGPGGPGDDRWNTSYGSQDHDDLDPEAGHLGRMSMGRAGDGHGGYGGRSDFDDLDGVSRPGMGGPGGMALGGMPPGAGLAAGGFDRRQSSGLGDEAFDERGSGTILSQTEDYPEEEFQRGISAEPMGDPPLRAVTGPAPGQAVYEFYGAHEEQQKDRTRRSTYKYYSQEVESDSVMVPPPSRPERSPPPPPPIPPAPIFPETMSTQSSRLTHIPLPPQPVGGMPGPAEVMGDPRVHPFGDPQDITRRLDVHSFEEGRSVSPPSSVQEPALSGSQRRVMDSGSRFDRDMQSDRELPNPKPTRGTPPEPPMIPVRRAIIADPSAEVKSIFAAAKQSFTDPKNKLSSSKAPTSARKTSPTRIFDMDSGDTDALLRGNTEGSQSSSEIPQLEAGIVTSVETGSEVPWPYIGDNDEVDESVSGSGSSGALPPVGKTGGIGAAARKQDRDWTSRDRSSPDRQDDTAVSVAQSRSSFEGSGFIPRPDSGPVISYLRGRAPPRPLSLRKDVSAAGSESSRSVVQTTPAELRRMREPFVKQQAARLSSEEGSDGSGGGKAGASGAGASSGVQGGNPAAQSPPASRIIPARAPNANNLRRPSSPIAWLRGSDTSRFS